MSPSTAVVSVLPDALTGMPLIFALASVAAWVVLNALEAAMAEPPAGLTKLASPDRVMALAVPVSVAVKTRFCLLSAPVTMTAETPAAALLIASRRSPRVFLVLSSVMSTDFAEVPLPWVRVSVRVALPPKSITGSVAP